LGNILKDPGSAITHMVGGGAALAAGIPLIVFAALKQHWGGVLAIIVFFVSIVLLYTASSVYHSLNISPRVNKVLRKFDHMMIFVLIAGSYTPICIIAMHNLRGYILLSVIWTIAIAGMALKACWINCPDWLSSAIYIAMGWASVSALGVLYTQMWAPEFWLLLAGGIVYTVGGVLYAFEEKFPNFGFKNFGMHEIFHLFVMGGSACHFVVMYMLAIVPAK